ncbi:alpha/beta fold hydrolase [Paraburkholderia edwinii]|uniref:alpha/beta fold hydrolase n=1 Tax=Paraburkholderia edwinii TaxID=2861782 RepID=UPI001FEA6963|nr:alpha/beta hydrolase [Paraburkholderia edwinii]
MNSTAASNAFSSATPVIALHCSGSGATQWRKLGEALGSRHALVAPEHYGCESTGPWSGERAFTLADEAARTVSIIDASCSKVHLVGHSYGGGVALRAALERPQRIASLTLYEPSAFHLLKTMGSYGAHGLAEIFAISKRTADGVSCGDYRGAAASFVDYWGGPGAWQALRPHVQAALTRWAPKAPLDFRALLDERTPANAYAALRVPALILRGQHAPAPTRAIAERLPMLLPAARLAVVEGAGHMGPVTHADEVNAAIVRHIAETDRGLFRAQKESVEDAVGSLSRI